MENPSLIHSFIHSENIFCTPAHDRHQARLRECKDGLTPALRTRCSLLSHFHTKRLGCEAVNELGESQGT